MWLTSTLTIVLLFLGLHTEISAQGAKYAFDRLGLEQGLPSLSVFTMAQDSRGFLWFGTTEGLCRYDGYNAKLYDRTPLYVMSAIFDDKQGSIWYTPSGEIHRLDLTSGKVRRYDVGRRPRAWRFLRDMLGDLWVNTNGEGLARYNRSNDSFVQYAHQPGNNASLCSDTVHCMYEDSRKELWVGTSAGLERVNRQTGTFLHEDSLRSNVVRQITECSDGAIWIATDNGLCRLDRTSNSFTRYVASDQKSNYLYMVHEDRSKRLWVVESKWIGRLNRKTNRLEIVKDLHQGVPLRPWGGSPVIFEDRVGRVWFDIQEGLAVFGPRSDTCEIVMANLRDPYSLPSFPEDKLEDDSGNLWVATRQHGVCMLDRNRMQFSHSGKLLSSGTTVTTLPTTSILEDSSGILWIGSAGELCRFDLTSGNTRHYSVPGIQVNTLLEVAQGTLWLGTGEGLYRFSPATEKLTRLSSPLSPPLTRPVYDSYRTLLKDRSGRVWTGGSIGNGLLGMFDPSTGASFSHFVDADSSRFGLASFPITSLLEDTHGALWFSKSRIGTFDRGRIRFFPNCSDAPGSKTNCGTTSIRAGADGTLWVGTHAGLERFNPADSTFSFVGVDQGLRGTPIMDLLEDNSGLREGKRRGGNLWLLTLKGITRYDPSTGAVRNYGPADGVAVYATEFRSSCFKNRDGYLYFGGTNGFVRFHPDSVHDNTFIPPIFLTAFKKFNVDAELDSGITAKKAVTLSYAENVISFEFAALNYTRPEKNQFAYKLEGFDEGWVNCGTRRTATYTNLEPGSYIFRVKGSNNDGLWNEQGVSLSIVITPPWWKTMWAYLAYVVIIGGMLYSVYRVRVNRLRLVHKLQLEQLESTKMHELDQLKSQFFTNISHEFRTPLTLILGPASQLLEGSNDEETKTKADFIHRSASKLNRLVDELLDLARIEAGQMRLNARPVNVISAVRDVVLTFQPFAERKKVTCRCSCDEDEIVAYLDKDKFDKILTNVLSNAFKFTPEGGSVDVSVNARHLQDGNTVTITIADTGIGIPTNQLEKIFDRFYQVDGSHTREQEGTGIGLALTKELVELHKGRIEVDSVEGKGSTFRLIFPLGTAHLKPEEMGGDEGEDEHDNPPSLVDDAVEGTDRQERDNGVSEKSALPSLLIVEDNADVRKYISSILENTYRIIEAHDGEDGLEKSQGCMPDLIITDIMMPKMDGFQLCGKLKTDTRTSHIPVIMLTAKATSKDKINGLEIGADDYIMKPFEARELEARIRNLIEQRKRLHEHFRAHGLVEMVEKNITSVDQRFLQRAVEVIDEHIADTSFGIAVFAEEMAVSRSLLIRKMESLLGQPPSELIKRTRLNKAAKLLEARAGNISEIALEVGFSNPSHFTESFRRQFGCTPSQYYHNSQHPPSGRPGSPWK